MVTWGILGCNMLIKLILCLVQLLATDVSSIIDPLFQLYVAIIGGRDSGGAPGT